MKWESSPTISVKSSRSALRYVGKYLYCNSMRFFICRERWRSVFCSFLVYPISSNLWINDSISAHSDCLDKKIKIFIFFISLTL